MKDPDKKGTAAQQLDKALERAKIEDELIESLGDGLRKFGEAATKLNETVEAAGAISEYNQQIQEGVKNMNALNSLYELQLQTSSQQMEASTQFLQNLSTSIEDSKRFQQEVGKLAENLSALNQVYGNMLNAMNPNK
jgi:gliding motility-associated protein GldL